MYTAAAAPACMKSYKIIDHCSGIYVAMMIYSVILDCKNAAAAIFDNAPAAIMYLKKTPICWSTRFPN
jgi:hypothetical protein